MTLARRITGLQRGAITPFVPTDIAGLFAWYEFFDPASLYTDTGRTTPVASDGDTIRGVDDKSGAGNHVSNSTGAEYKTGILNSQSVGRFAASGNKLQSAALAGGDKTQPTTIFIVAKTSSDSAYRLFTDGVTSGKRQIINYRNGGTAHWAMMSISELQGSSTADTNFHIFAGIFNGASSKLYVGGGAADASGNPGTDPLGDITLGNDSTGVTALNGDIFAAIYYSGALSTTDLDRVGGYLATASALSWSATS